MATFKFLNDVPSGLSDLVTVDANAKTITVSKTTDYTFIGTYLVEIDIKYESCANVSGSSTFTLNIVCDGLITLTTAAAAVSVDYLN